MATRNVTEKTTSKISLDTSIAGDVTLNPKAPIFPGFEKSSAKVSGIMKGALMWYRILLTEVGSNPLNKTEGTRLSELFQSNIVDRDVLLTFAKREIDAATDQTRAYQLLSFAPAEEQVVSVSIASFTLDSSKSSLEFSVSIISALGEQAGIALPSIAIS